MSSITLIRPERNPVVDPTTSDSRDRRRFPPSLSGALGWTVAALGVYAVEWGAHGAFAGLSSTIVALVKIAVIVAAGGIYARTARHMPSSLVLASGIAWLVFSIAADVITGIGSAGAYQLLGDPTAMSGLLRNLTILAWVSAPAVFARGSDRNEHQRDSRGYR